jgi:DNA-binding NarL/FixJ family response regulator
MNKWRALVAEDCTYILFGIETLLESNGIEIVGSAATLAEMRRLAESVPADIAILDVNLNGEMSFPVADLLIGRGVPVVFTTGYAPDKLFPAHLRSVPTLQKPYDPDMFLRIVENAIVQTEAHKLKASS